MATATKPFPLRVLLSVTTERLLTESTPDGGNGIGGLYEILNWMTSDELFTHQLPRANNECKPWLLRWFPELAGFNDHLDAFDETISRTKDKADVEAEIRLWVIRGIDDLGAKETYDVPKIPIDDHERKDPYDELVQMRGTDEGVILANVDGSKREDV